MAKKNSVKDSKKDSVKNSGKTTVKKAAPAAKKISAKSSVVPEGQTAAELFKPRNEKKAATAKKAGGAKKLANEMIAKEDSAASKKLPRAKELMAPRVQATQDRLYGEVAIEEAELERFPNRTHVRRYTISFTCPEFTCLCPRSGFPDFATIKIQYVPDQYCVELKSLKLYINGFRNKKVFHEDVTNVIIQDMIDLLDPWEIEVIGDFTVRGNIHTVITAYHDKEAE